MGKLHTCHGMSCQDRSFDPESIHKLANIFCEGIHIVSCFGMIRLSMSAAGESRNMKFVAEAWGEIIKVVCVTPHACKKQEHVTCSTPIEIMQFDSVYVYKVTFMRGSVHTYFLLYAS